MIAGIFNGLTSGASSFITFLTSLFNNVIDIFWDSTATTPQLTDVGQLFVTAVAVGFVYFGLRFITRLIKFRA